jgi:hypothetical protein
MSSLGMTAFVSWFLGAAGGMSDCFENGRLTGRRADAAHRPRAEAPSRPYHRHGGEPKDHRACAQGDRPSACSLASVGRH